MYTNDAKTPNAVMLSLMNSCTWDFGSFQKSWKKRINYIRTSTSALQIEPPSYDMCQFYQELAGCQHTSTHLRTPNPSKMNGFCCVGFTIPLTLQTCILHPCRHVPFLPLATCWLHMITRTLTLLKRKFVTKIDHNNFC